MVRPEKLYQACGWKSRRGKHAGAPRSRLRASSEISPSERSVESPSRAVGFVGGEQSCGPNVSEPLQPREIGAERRSGRARHVGVKARDCACWSGDAAQDPSGVGKAARSASLVRNRSGPTQPPTSGKDPGYKPSAKCRGAGRESEGFVVPGKAVKAAGGKGPYFGHGERRRTCEGMVARPDNPVAEARQAISHLGCNAKCRWLRFAEGDVALGVTPRLCRHRSRAAGTQACIRRPSVSRMPEIGTYGLNGGRWRRAA